MPEVITHQTNRVYAFLWTIASGVILLKGGQGSGKSVAAVQRVIDLALEGRGCLALRKIRVDGRYSIYQLVENTLKGLGIYNDFIHDKGNWEFRYKYGPGFIRCGGLDDPKRVKSMVGISVILLEEATDFTIQDYEELDARIRGTKDKLFILVFNPMSQYSWINAYFYKQLNIERGLTGTDEERIGRDSFRVKDPMSGLIIELPVFALSTNYLDNAFLEPRDRAAVELLRTTNPARYRVMGEALWGISEGTIISNFRVEHFEPSIVERIRQRSNGLDFGFVHNTALVQAAYTPSEKRVHVYGGFYGPGLTTPEIISKLSSVRFYPGDIIRADSADPGRIKEIKRAGFQIVGAAKGKGSLEIFARWAREQEWIIHTTAQFLADEFAGWKYTKVRGEKIDRPAEGTESNPDDAVAAARYLSEPWRSKETRGTGRLETVSSGSNFRDGPGF